MTTVISVRGRDRAALLADPNFVYVGRAVPRAGWEASIFANPWKPTEDYPVERVVADFARALAEAPPARDDWPDWPGSPFSEMKRRLHLLRGKVLGCWCCDYDGVSDPMPSCHAAVLARLANGLEVNNGGVT